MVNLKGQNVEENYNWNAMGIGRLAVSITNFVGPCFSSSLSLFWVTRALFKAFVKTIFLGSVPSNITRTGRGRWSFEAFGSSSAKSHALRNGSTGCSEHAPNMAGFMGTKGFGAPYFETSPLREMQNKKRIVFRAHGVVNRLEVSRLVGAVLYMLFSFRRLVIPQDQDAKSCS